MYAIDLLHFQQNIWHPQNWQSDLTESLEHAMAALIGWMQQKTQSTLVHDHMTSKFQISENLRLIEMIVRDRHDIMMGTSTR